MAITMDNTIRRRRKQILKCDEKIMYSNLKISSFKKCLKERENYD